MSLKSMTGFGRAEKIVKGRKISVEIKSVNHRFGEFNIKLPREFNPIELEIRKLFKENVRRGKVDIFINVFSLDTSNYNLIVDKNLASNYLTIYNELKESLQVDGKISALDLMKFPDVCIKDENNTSEEELKEILFPVLKEAIEKFNNTREREAQHLKVDLEDKLKTMLTYINDISQSVPEIISAYQKKLEIKIKELLKDEAMDESRVLTEVALFSDKICIDEELVRLKSHVEAMIDSMNKKDEVGREFDFLAQEMNREANTMLSKTTDLKTSKTAIELKTIIEAIREQIQNLE